MDEFCKATMPPLNQLSRLPPTIHVNVSSLMDACLEFQIEAKYSKPMVFIGLYILLASFSCYLAVWYDLEFGISSKKYWIPPKYFSLNAISITMIAIAIKLPMDLNSSMPHLEDQAAKIGSLGFMCTMMSHLMPSLRSTNNISNVSALSLLVITVIVNVGIQLNTGVMSDEYFLRMIACIYMDILAACLTNMPRVLKNCNESAIEKREDSVTDATKLPERTSKIIKILETRELPSMDKDKMAYIDEWRLHLRQP